MLLLCTSDITYAQNTVKPILTINPGPYDTICAGSQVIFTAVSVGAGNHPVYSWTKNGKHIKGTLGDTYATTDLEDGDIISCTLVKSVSSSNTVSVSASTRIAVHNIPTVAIVSSNSPLCEGDTLRLSAVVVNEGATYQWSGPDGFEITGNGSLLPDIQPDAEGYYKVRANLQGCLSAPDSLYVIVNSKVTPRITLIPAPSNSVCIGTPVTLTASTEHGGNEPTYQWLKNNVPIPGATNNSYLEMEPTNGDSITLLLTSNAICPSSKTVSSTMPLIVSPYFTPAVSISANTGSTITQGNELTLTASTNAAKYASYQWKKNGINIPGANSRTFTTREADNNDVYSVAMSTGAQCPLSNTAGSNKIAAHVLPSIASTAEQGISVAPNPSNGNMLIKGTFPGEQEASIEVLSVIGRCVYKGTVALQNGSFSKQLNLDVPNGIYMLRSKAGDQSFTQRIVISH